MPDRAIAPVESKTKHYEHPSPIPVSLLTPAHIRRRGPADGWWQDLYLRGNWHDGYRTIQPADEAERWGVHRNTITFWLRRLANPRRPYIRLAKYQGPQHQIVLYLVDI